MKQDEPAPDDDNNIGRLPENKAEQGTTFPEALQNKYTSKQDNQKDLKQYLDTMTIKKK